MGKKGQATESRSARIDKIRIAAGVGPMTLSSGVVVQARAVSPLMVSAAIARIPKPQVPKQFIEDKGREEENPFHPEYLRDLASYHEAIGNLSQRITLHLGTDIISIPDGMPEWDDQRWIDALAFTGLEIPEDPRERRICWLQYVAMPSLDDTRAVSLQINRLSGIPEEAVQEAAAMFQGDEAR